MIAGAHFGERAVPVRQALDACLALVIHAQLPKIAIRVDLAVLRRITRLADAKVALFAGQTIRVRRALDWWNRVARACIARLTVGALCVAGATTWILTLEVDALRRRRTVIALAAEGAQQTASSDTREGVIALGVGRARKRLTVAKVATLAHAAVRIVDAVRRNQAGVVATGGPVGAIQVVLAAR